MKCLAPLGLTSSTPAQEAARPEALAFLGALPLLEELVVGAPFPSRHSPLALNLLLDLRPARCGFRHFWRRFLHARRLYLRLLNFSLYDLLLLVRLQAGPTRRRTSSRVAGFSALGAASSPYRFLFIAISLAIGLQPAGLGGFVSNGDGFEVEAIA